MACKQLPIKQSLSYLESVPSSAKCLESHHSGQLKMDYLHGIVIGDTVESGRRGDGQFPMEWRIPDFLSGDGRFRSPPFHQCGGRWVLAMSPNALPLNRPSEERDRVNMGLIRLDPNPPKTFHVTLGIRGAEGVENKKVIEQEFSDGDNECWWVPFCTRSKLESNVFRLMPGNELVIACDVRCGGHRDASTQTDEIFSGAEVLTKRKSTENIGRQNSEVLVLYTYNELQSATQNFDDKPLQAGGCKIGEGGFGTVYRAVIGGDVVAVKKLKAPGDKEFITELRTLTRYKHENLLPLLGCSLDPTCLLYEYLPNGSLQDRLAIDDGSEPLSWQIRLSISYGTALGINHLHTSGEKIMVHRDIKSANILLDHNLVPKVGDFGLVRTGTSSGSDIIAVTREFRGTRAYMPREAWMGDVSAKWDTFSFGVVLLELLTGLPPYDRKRKHRYMVMHVENCKDELPSLDPRAEWNQEAATKFYKIARWCVAESKRNRPYVSEILEDLRILSSAKKITQRNTSFFSKLLGKIF